MAKAPEEWPDAADGSGATSHGAMRAALAQQLGERSRVACAPPAVPDHVLLRHIGSGAYGDVWLARNALGTLRAVKVVYRARFEDARPYEREFNGILKYEPISRTHEGLVQVLHVGRNDEAGCFYYVMELADGTNAERGMRSAEQPAAAAPVPHSALRAPHSYSPRTLRSELRHQQRLSPIAAAQLTLRLAGALAHLHSHSLVHRDIKPGNVIFVGGQPKLADIGLVTDVGTSHSFVGTEGFVPPEGPGSPQADLYGLGKLLYELATGRDRMDFPQLPPRVSELPEGEALLELNEVMTRACAPEAIHRYASATELQAELNLFLAGRSLRRARNIERHLAQLKRFAIAACAFLMLAGVALWFSKREAHHARERAHAADQRARLEAESRLKETTLRQRAEAAEQEAEQQLYSALFKQAHAMVRSGELGQRVYALDALKRAAAISNSAELRQNVLAALALPDLRVERDLPIGPDFTFVQMDPAFQRLAVGRGRAAVEIRATSDQRLLASLPASTNFPAHVGIWSPDGRFLAVKRDQQANGYRGTLEVWDVPEARRVLLLHDLRWDTMSFHPRAGRLLAGRQGGFATIWDLQSAQEVSRFKMPDVPWQLRFSPDGERFVASCQVRGGWLVSVHDATNGSVLASNHFPEQVTAAAWHPGGSALGVTDASGAVYWIDLSSGEARLLGRHKAQAATVAFNPDGGYLFSGGWERELIGWDLRTKQRALTIGLDSFQLQFSADGRQCLVLSRSGSATLYRFERPNPLEFAEDLGTRLQHAAFSPDGRWLAASGNKCLGLWDLKSNGPGALAEEGRETRPSFTPDGSELFGSSRDDDCFRWRVTPGTNGASPPELQRLRFQKPPGFTSLSLISNTVAMTTTQGTRLLIPALAGAAPSAVSDQASNWAPTLPGISTPSPDGRWLAIHRPFTSLLYVYGLPDLKRVAKLASQANVAHVRFSPDSDEVAISSRGQVEFWSTKTWQRTRALTNFSGIQFTSDSNTWWLARDYFGGAALYDSRTQEPLLPLPSAMLPLAVSPDGRHVAVSVDARRLQVWDLAEVRRQLRELGLDWAER